MHYFACMIYNYNDYRNFLRDTLVEKISKNPNYSLRAMAQNLEVSPSTLSEVLKGKRNLSAERAFTIAGKLGLMAKEHEYFCLLVQSANASSPEVRESIQKRMEKLNPRKEVVQNLTVDLFRTIADWHHSAILHLSELQDFQFKDSTIAQRLGISRLEADAAIERLLRLGLLTQDAKGRFSPTTEYLVEAKVPNESLQRFHKQMLEKAIESLQGQTPKEKIIRTETIAIDPKLLPEADELVEEFVGKMTQLFRKSRKKTTVYHLGIQFFNLLRKESL